MDFSEDVLDRFTQSIREGDTKEMKNILSAFPGLANAKLPGYYDREEVITPLSLAIMRGKCVALTLYF